MSGAPRRSARTLLVLLALLGAAACVVAVVLRERALRELAVEALAVIERPALFFLETTREAGLDHPVVPSNSRQPLEAFCGAAAFADLDADEDPDLVLAYTRAWVDPGGQDSGCGILVFENDGAGRFREVTAEAGLAAPIRALGIAAADQDGDGRVDLFLAAAGSDRLYRNLGGWRFEDVTATSGVAGDSSTWSSGATWLDHDGDGDLDLIVAAFGREPASAGGEPHPPAQLRLLENQGDGRFEDVSAAAGVRLVEGAGGAAGMRALSVRATDLDQDGTVDVIVTGFAGETRLFRGTGEGHFDEIGGLSGVGFDALGNMTDDTGVTVVWEDDGGKPSPRILLGRVSGAPPAWYLPDTTGLHFRDAADAAGLARIDPGETGATPSFGVAAGDLDLDGRTDLVITGGAPEGVLARWQVGLPVSAPTRFFWSAPSGFELLTSEELGTDALAPLPGRATLLADIDGDGDLDVLVTGSRGAPLLLTSDLPGHHHWLRLRLAGRPPNTLGLGARIELEAGGRIQHREVQLSGGYLAQDELTQTFGLGEATTIERIAVRWPDGHIQLVTNPRCDRLLVIEE